MIRYYSYHIAPQSQKLLPGFRSGASAGTYTESSLTTLPSSMHLFSNSYSADHVPLTLAVTHTNTTVTLILE